jgi:hypothetical protein
MATKNRTLGKLLSTSNATIYTVPVRYITEVTSIVISNASASTVTVTLTWTDAVLATTYSITEQVPMYGRSVVQLTHAFTLQANDVISGYASASSAITISVKVQEEYSVVY